MKNLKDNAMMQEMSLQDMKDVNGGSPWWALYELMCEYLIDNREAITGAYAQVTAEGGTVATDMPFK